MVPEAVRIARDVADLAYRSAETDPEEIFVRFPDATGRWQISDGGGFLPRWSPDGSELWYWQDGDLIVADVETDPTFALIGDRVLLESPNVQGFTWDLHPSGERFVALRAGEGRISGPPQGRFRVVINWFDELRAQGLLREGN